jgi:hypothetical protein
MDGDADPMTFAWTASPSGCATFANAAALSTNLTAQVAGSCVITFTVTAGGKSDNASASLAISPATGDISVVVTYVPHPLITAIAFSTGGGQIASVLRTAPDATIRTPFHQGTAYTVTLSMVAAPDGAVDLADSCGGAIVQPVFVAGASSASGTWTPGVSSGACIVTARLTRQTLVDSFPVVVLPAP